MGKYIDGVGSAARGDVSSLAGCVWCWSWDALCKGEDCKSSSYFSLFLKGTKLIQKYLRGQTQRDTAGGTGALPACLCRVNM